MPYPPEHHARTRKNILRAARTLFNRHGFSQVKIADVMKQAGLTHGGFYSYFENKSELYAEAIGLVLRAGWLRQVQRKPTDRAASTARRRRSRCTGTWRRSQDSWQSPRP